MNNSLNLNMEDLNRELEEIEARRKAVLEQLELANKVDAIAAELISSLTSALSELEKIQQEAIAKKVVQALHPYLPADFVTSSTSTTTTAQPEITTKRKRGELGSIEDFTGVVKLNERLGAKKEEDGSYTAFIGLDNRRSSKNNPVNVGVWKEYINQYHTNAIEVLENAGDLIKGAYLISAMGLTVRSVGMLSNLNFEQLPDSEENNTSSYKEPMALDENLQLLNTDAEQEPEVITEAIRETEPIEEIPNIDLSAYLPEELMGAKIRTSEYGTLMVGTLTRYVEGHSKPWVAVSPDMPVELWMPDGGFSILELPSELKAA